MAGVKLRLSLWALAIAAALVLALLLTLPYFASTRLVQDRIAEEISAWTGLDVSIASAPEISVWPDLQANLSDVTLSLPGDQALSIVAKRVEIELSALAALRGDVEFTTARFIEPTILIEGDATLAALPDRSRIAQALEAARTLVAENRSAPDISRLPSDPFGVVEFSGGRIVAVSDEAESEIATSLTGKMSWKALNGAASLTAAGAAQGEAFSVDASSASALLFLGGAATPVKMELKSPSANFSFDGTASLGENPFADGRVSFSAPSAGKILHWSGAALPHTPGAITVESRLMGDAERLRFEDARITFDGKPAHGALDLLLTGKLPTITGTLAFDVLDLSVFLSAFTPLDPAAVEGPGIIDAEFASGLNLDLRLSAARAAVGPFTLADVAATARVDEGTVAFDISDASAFGGNIQASLRFDRKAAGTQIEMRLLATDVDGGAFASAAGMTRLAPIGRGTVSLILKGEGESWNTLLAGASGSFSASFGQGALSGIDLEGFVARAKGEAPFDLDAVEKGASPIESLELKANIAAGTARIERAELRAPLGQITLTGTAPLAGGSLNLSGKVGPRQQATAGGTEIDSPTTFLVNGPWSAPIVTPTTGLSAK